MEFADLVKDYLDDAAGHLKAFDDGLMTLERDGYRPEVVSSVLGPLHTLKGNSGMMGYDSLKRYIHEVEEVLKRVMEQGVLPPPALELILDSANIIRNTLAVIAGGKDTNPDLSAEVALLRNGMGDRCDTSRRQMSDLSSYLGARTETIRVDFKRLDDLLDLAGELLIYKTRLNQIESRVRAAVSDKALTKDFNEGLGQIGKTISGLQEGIMRVRMLPVNQVFQKFPRMVRDLAHSQGKEVQLSFEGEETELDKTVIDELEEPLLHIIRNAVDHGIEAPQERVMKGKGRTGSITLSASQESNYVIIRVRDDGSGINLEDIRDTAVRRGLVRQDETPNREHLLSLIFAAGFTTKQEATDVSGRGIGLDVVSRNIAKLNGHISVDCAPGRGTQFTIKLPLSLAIIPALMAEAGGEVYAIPMNAVDESIKVREEDIHFINRHEVVRFRERVIPVVRLDRFFGLEHQNRKRFHLVILSRAERRMAVAVDRLRGQQEIVIKPLDDTLGKSHGVAGASILGDGRIVLILDVVTIWSRGPQGHELQQTAVL